MRSRPHQAEGYFLAARANSRQPFDTRWAEAFAARRAQAAVAQLLYADALARAGDTGNALRRFDAALAIDPQLDCARLARASMLLSSGQPLAADLDRLSAGSLFAAHARVIRAISRVRQNDWLGGFEDLDVAIDLAPDFATAINARGFLRVHTGHWKTAAADFETGFQIEPALEECRHNWRLLQRQAARASKVSGSLTIYVTDFGAESWNRRQQLMADFSGVATPAVVPHLPPAGQILIPMPERPPTGRVERQTLIDRIAEGIQARIGSAGPGLDTFQIRITENVKGKRCTPLLPVIAEAYAETAYAALDRVKTDLKNRAIDVTMPAIMAGSAAYTFTQVTARMPATPFDSVVLIRVCLEPEPVQVVYLKMDGNLKIVNPESPVDSATGEADRAPEEIHQRVPGLQMFSATGDDGDPPPDYDPDSQLQVHGSRSTPPAPDMRMTFWELLRWQPPGPAQPATRGGISLSPTTMVRTPGGGVRFQSDLPEDAEFLLVTPIFGFQLR